MEPTAIEAWPMKRIHAAVTLGSASLYLFFVLARASMNSHKINLPTGKTLQLAVPGFIGLTNSYPATISLSPDGRFAAFLNQGYGTEKSGVRESIGILDLTTNQLRDFPDDRLRGDEKFTLMSYCIGLAFSSESARLYASMSSTSTNGIAVYRFAGGEVTQERFIEIPTQPVA